MAVHLVTNMADSSHPSTFILEQLIKLGSHGAIAAGNHTLSTYSQNALASIVSDESS